MELGNPETPLTEQDLTATKPTQDQMDTAKKVLWWLYAQARLFPDDWGSGLAISTDTLDVLVAAANACGGDVEMINTTYAEQMEQQAHNRRVTEDTAAEI